MMTAMPKSFFGSSGSVSDLTLSTNGLGDFSGRHRPEPFNEVTAKCKLCNSEFTYVYKQGPIRQFCSPRCRDNYNYENSVKPAVKKINEKKRKARENESNI